MSLPARQQRLLNRTEGALQSSEPHLASMYAVFTRLTAGEPVAAESLARRPLLRRGAAGYAAVLIPVMFAIILGGLLGGSARGAAICGGAGHPASRGASLASRASCPAPLIPGTPAAPAPPAARHQPAEHQPFAHRHAQDMLKMIKGRRVPCRSSSSGMKRQNC